MLKMARKLIVLVIGLTVILLGLIMVITPGPAVVVIPIGLAILATEFLWAKRLLRKIKAEGGKIGKSLFNSKSKSEDK